MTNATAAFLDQLKAKQGAKKTVWCQHGKLPGLNNDEHQVCLDMQGRHELEYGPGTWSCPCSCHR